MLEPAAVSVARDFAADLAGRFRHGAPAAELVSVGADRLARRHSRALGYRTDLRAPAADARGRAGRGACIRPRTISIWSRALGFPSGPLEPRIDGRRRRCGDGRRRAAERRRVGRPRAARRARAGRRLRRRQALAGRRRSPRSPTRSRDDGGRGRADRQRRAIAAAGARSCGALGGDAASSNLIGRTDLPTLAGVLVSCRGARLERFGRDAPRRRRSASRVTAMFGPTDERATRPLGRGAARRADPSTSGAARACCASVRSITAACAASASTACSRRSADGDARDARRPCSSIATARSSRRSATSIGRSASSCIPGASTRSARSTARACASCGHEPVGRRARLLHRGGRRRRCTGTSSALLAAGGAHIDAYYYCPHHPDGTVAGVRARLRLPQAGARPGRPRRRASSASIPARSFVVGDRWLDVALARAVGARGILVRTGYGATEEARPPAGLDGRRGRQTIWSKRRAGFFAIAI